MLFAGADAVLSLCLLAFPSHLPPPLSPLPPVPHPLQPQLRPLYALPLILFFMLLPIGMFTGAFAQLSVALCGNPNDPATRSGSWYCSDNSWATFMRNALTSLAPSIVLSIYNM